MTLLFVETYSYVAQESNLFYQQRAVLGREYWRLLAKQAIQRTANFSIKTCG